LITSPLVNEVAVLMLLSLVGWKITAIYVVIGIAVGVLSGAFLDMIHAEKWLQPFALKAYQRADSNTGPTTSGQHKMPLRERHQFAKQELFDIVGRIWKWIIIGVGVGAALHGFVPEAWFKTNLGNGQWWSVPLAVILGIPLYSNATGVIPVMESLILKGVPLGTTMAFCMSTVAASFPEFVLLKQVMRWKLLATVFVTLLLAFTVVGWVLNLIPFNPGN
jgi:uncharacterized protein